MCNKDVETRVAQKIIQELKASLVRESPSPMYSIMKSPLLMDSRASTPQPQSSVCKANTEKNQP